MIGGCSISVIIPVLNEAGIINETINALTRLPHDARLEIIIVDGGPCRETLNVIQRTDVQKIPGRKGRSCQLNEGARNAAGEILLFLHADTELPLNALNTISSVMKEEKYVGGAFDLGIKSGKPVFRLIETAASLRSRFTRIPYGDQAIFIRKEYFHAAGRFREIPIMEDVELMRRIKKAGDKIYIVPEKVGTSARRWEKEGIVYCTLRNWILITLYSMGVPPEKLAAFYKH